VDTTCALGDVSSVIRWLLALMLGVAVAYIAYGRTGSSTGARTLLLASMRAIAVALVAALLLGAPGRPARTANALVALDASSSWLRGAPGDTALLRDALRTAVRDASADSVYLIGDSLRAVSAKDALTLTPVDVSSVLRPAVDRAVALGRPLILLTDGEVDDPSVQADLPAGSRIVVPARSAKLDAAVASMEAPLSATGGDTIVVSAVLAAGGAGANKSIVKLLLDGQMLASVSSAPMTAFSSRRIVMSSVLPKGAKKSILHVVVSAEGDVEARNDTLAAALEVGDKPAAVFVSTAPDLDVREALSVLRGALDVPAKAYLRIAPNVWREEGSLKPIAESDVRARALEAGMVILHGDTAWGGVAARTKGAHALWAPAPPAALARAGENQKNPEWYVSSAPPSPLSGALSGLPWDTLPPISMSAPAKGAFNVLEARLGKSGVPVAVVAGRETAGFRTLVITGSGFAGWSLRGGRSAAAFQAMWGAMFDWLSAARGDLRAARPIGGVVRAGEPIRWRRGGIDSLVVATLTKRGAKSDSLKLKFANGGAETTSPPLPPGVYDVSTTGGASVLVVNVSRELVPRAPVLSTGASSRGVAAASGVQLADMGWAFALALVLLCGEWLLRRYAGFR
jgi:hypothetical protein